MIYVHLSIIDPLCYDIHDITQHSVHSTTIQLFWCNILTIRHSKWPLELLTDVVFLTTPVPTEPVSSRPLVCSISIMNGKAIQLSM